MGEWRNGEAECRREYPDTWTRRNGGHRVVCVGFPLVDAMTVRLFDTVSGINRVVQVKSCLAQTLTRREK